MALPVALLGGSSGGAYRIRSLSGGPDSVVGGVRSVGGGLGGGLGLSSIGLACCGVGGERGGARLAHLYPSARPGTSRFDGPPRPVVSRVLVLEVREYALGAVGGPERQ